MLVYQQILRESTGLNEDWLLGVFIVQLILIAWLSVNYSRRFKGLFMAVLNRELEKHDFSETPDWTSTYSLAFMSIFFLSFSWFVYLVLRYFNLFQENGTNQFLIFILILLGSVLLYLMKLLLLTVVSSLTPRDYGVNQYSYSIGQFYQLAGLALIPVVVMGTFNPEINIGKILLIGAIIYLSVFLLRLLRGMINSYLSEAQPFYIILYLCTFEILPVLIAVKYLNPYFSVV